MPQALALAQAPSGFEGIWILFSCLPLLVGIAAIVYALVLLTRIDRKLEHLRERLDRAIRERGAP